MKFVTGIEDIIERFQSVERNLERAAPLVAKKISDSWDLMINLTDAIDSGDYLRAIAPHPVQTTGEMLEFIIDTSNNPAVNYSGFVEDGTKNMPARHPAESAIERDEFFVVVTDAVERGLD